MNRNKSIYSLLIKLQLSKELLGAGLKKKGDKARSMAGTVVLYIALGLLLAASFGAMFLGLAELMGEYGLGWIYMGIMGFMVILMSFFMTVFLVQSQLFESKDNELLLAMPIKPRAILVSRVIGILIMSYGTAAVIALPALFIYIKAVGLGIVGIIAFALELLFLPMLGVTLAILIGWLVGTAVSKSKHKKLVQTVLTFLGIGLYFFFYMNLTSGMEGIIEAAIENENGLKGALPVLYYAGAAIADGDIKSLIITILMCVIPFAAACLLISTNFNKVITGNKGERKIEYKAGRMASSGKSFSMIKKEFSRLFSSPTYMMNGAMGFVMIIIMPLFVIFQINGSDDPELQGMDIGAFLGSQSITPIIVLVIILFMLGLVTMAASTVSLDAKTLWLLKSAPVKGDEILLSKAAPHALMGIPSIVVCCIILQVFLKLSAINFVLILITALLGNIFNAFIDLLLGAKFPKLDWLTEMEAIKQGKAALLSMAVNTVMPAAIIGLYFLVRKMKFFKPTMYMIVIALFYLIAIIVLYRLIKRKGQTIIDNLPA